MLKVIRNNMALIRYLMVAIGGVLISLVVSAFLQNNIGLGFTRSLFIGYLCGMVYGFFATRYFAFNAREPYSIKREAIKYVLISTVALLVTSFTGTIVLIVVSWGITTYPKLHNFIAEIINQIPLLPTVLTKEFIGRIGGIGFGFFVNFFGHKFFTFRNTGTLNFVKNKQAEIIARRK